MKAMALDLLLNFKEALFDAFDVENDGNGLSWFGAQKNKEIAKMVIKAISTFFGNAFAAFITLVSLKFWAVREK